MCDFNPEVDLHGLPQIVHARSFTAFLHNAMGSPPGNGLLGSTSWSIRRLDSVVSGSGAGTGAGKSSRHLPDVKQSVQTGNFSPQPPSIRRAVFFFLQAAQVSISMSLILLYFRWAGEGISPNPPLGMMPAISDELFLYHLDELH